MQNKSKARKSGLYHATGNYVIFVDGDDYIEENLCECMYLAIKNKDVDFVHANFYENESKICNGIKEKKIYMPDFNNKMFILDKMVFEGAWKGNTLKENVIYPSIWSKIFRTDFIKKFYQYVDDDRSVGEDLICLCIMLIKCSSFGALTNAYYHYRYRNDSLSHALGIDHLADISAMFIALKKLFISFDCYERLKLPLEKYYFMCLLQDIKTYENDYFKVNLYYFDGIEQLEFCNVVIYGAGEVGKSFYNQFIQHGNINIIAFVDRDYQDKVGYPVHVKEPKWLENEQYDFLIIAMLDENVAMELADNLKRAGINKNKIIYKRPNNIIDRMLK